jgi:hypothetical protein
MNVLKGSARSSHVKKILGTASSIHLPEAGRLVWSGDDNLRRTIQGDHG